MATKKIEKLPTEHLNTDEVITRLGNFFSAPEYAFLTQVRNGTGYERGARTADAMAMSLWPSRGLDLIGFEVKVSRSDWVRELRNPEKADDMCQFMDRWYIVVGDASIVQPGELPPTWGLMVPQEKGHGIRIHTEAPKFKKVTPPDKLLLGGILRNISTRMIARDLIAAENKRSFESGKDWAKRELERRDDTNKELTEAIEAFEKASGVRISTWKGSNGDIGKAVREVLDGKHTKAHEKMLRIKESALNVAKFIDGEIQEYQI